MMTLTRPGATVRSIPSRTVFVPNALAALAPTLLPAWVTTDPQLRWIYGSGAAALAVALYWWLRPRSLVAGRILRAAMRYIEHDAQMIAVADAFDQAYDDIVEADPDAEIHVLAFSFGSIVALDAMIPRRADVARRHLRLSSITTIGAPVDFIRLFYPDHFADRTDSRVLKTVPWMNIWIPRDVFGSDFGDGDPSVKKARRARTPQTSAAIWSTTDASTTRTTRFTIGGLQPTVGVAEGRPVLKTGAILTLDGFSVHGRYWAKSEWRYLRRAIPQWIPSGAAGPPPPVAAGQPTIGDLPSGPLRTVIPPIPGSDAGPGQAPVATNGAPVILTP